MRLRLESRRRPDALVFGGAAIVDCTAGIPPAPPFPPTLALRVRGTAVLDAVEMLLEVSASPCNVFDVGPEVLADGVVAWTDVRPERRRDFTSGIVGSCIYPRSWEGYPRRWPQQRLFNLPALPPPPLGPFCPCARVVDLAVAVWHNDAAGNLRPWHPACRDAEKREGSAKRERAADAAEKRQKAADDHRWKALTGQDQMPR